MTKARRPKSPATIIRDLQRHTATLKPGARVVMPTNDEEGWNEERGMLLDVNYAKYVVTVKLDEEYRDGADDDGLRETGAEFVRLLK